ncbi:Protein of unknown function, partial [Gryllus bimaculatus]
HVE